MARPPLPSLAILTLAVLALSVVVPPAGAFRCYQSPIQVTDCNLAPPMALVSDAREDGVHLAWLAPAYGAVEEYTLYRHAEGDLEGTRIDVGSATTYLDVPPHAGVFVYVVTGSNNSGETPPSNPVATAWRWPYCLPATVEPEDFVEELVTYNSGCVFPLPVQSAP